MKKIALLLTLLFVGLQAGGCALVAAGVAGAVIEHQLDRGYCSYHRFDGACSYYWEHPNEVLWARAHRAEAREYYRQHHLPLDLR